MAKYQEIEHNGKPARLYEDGAIRNAKGHLLVQHPQAHTITAEDGAALALRKHERKRERIQAGALAAVREKLPDRFDGLGDDWIEAVAEAVAYKALDRLDPKQVDAARFLIKEAGFAEEQAQVSEFAGAVTDLMRQVAAFASAVPLDVSDNSNYRKHDVVDAQVQDASDDEESE